MTTTALQETFIIPRSNGVQAKSIRVEAKHATLELATLPAFGSQAESGRGREQLASPSSALRNTLANGKKRLCFQDLVRLL